MNAQGTRTRYLLAAVVAVTMTFGALGCGSSKSDTSSSPKTEASVAARADTGTTEADLKKAAAAANNANLADTADAYAYLSASCHDKFTSAEWVDNLHVINQGIRTAVPALANAKTGPVNVRNVTPTSAEAQIIIVDASGKELVGADKADWGEWVVEDGQWVTTKCITANELLGN